MPGTLSLKQMVISPYETLLYAISYIMLMFYFLKETYKQSQNPIYKIAVRNDTLGLPYDPSDLISLIMFRFMAKTWWIFLLFAVVSKILRTLFNPVAWSASTGVLGLLALTYIFGWKAIIAFFAIIALHAVPTMVFGSRALLWVVHLSFFFFQNSDYYEILCDFAVDRFRYVITLSFSWMFIRCIIFFDDAFRSKTAIVTKSSLAVSFNYFFFLPTFILGPVHLYRKFHTNVFNPIKPTPSFFISRFFRLVVVACVLKASYYIYYQLILMLPTEVPISVAVFIGCHYMNGLRFWLVHVLCYGTPKVLSAYVGIETPEWPKCISHILSYVEMWKTFDVGLHEFLREYIYFPLGGNRHGWLRRTFATSMIFTYVFIFHGSTQDVFVWTFFNFVQVVGEIGFIKLCHSDLAKPVVSALSPAWTRRIFSIMASISWQFSCLGFFVFTIGIEYNYSMLQTFNPIEFLCVFGLLGFLIAQLSVESEVRGWKNPKKPAKTAEIDAAQEELKKTN